jgi:hypothetical protein
MGWSVARVFGRGTVKSVLSTLYWSNKFSCIHTCAGKAEKIEGEKYQIAFG